jgi:hypothetical protein
MTTKKRRKERSSTTQQTTSQPGLTSLPEVPPLEAPQFPTFQELVDLDATSMKATGNRPLSDLFDGTLGDQTRLVEDFQRHPEKYGEESHDLLQRLASGSSSVDHLSPTDRRLLNLATFDFHQAVPPKKPPTPKKSTTSMQNKPLQRTGRFNKPKVKIQKPRPGVDVPVTELPVYWWLM